MVIRVQGLEVYSTVLWHMKKDKELSYLAQEGIAQDRRSPQAWAIMGNCFSLQKVSPPSPSPHPTFAQHTALLCMPSSA